MSGRVFDLVKSSRLPATIALDTNILVNAFISQLVPSRANSVEVDRAQWLVSQCTSGETSAVLMPTVMNELMHLVIRWSFERDASAILPNERNPTWKKAFKVEPTRVRTYAKYFQQFVMAFEAAGLYIQDGYALPIPDTTSTSGQLQLYVRQLALLTSDAQIVIDAVRAGVDGIASQDRDFKRASAKLDIYTWG